MTLDHDIKVMKLTILSCAVVVSLAGGSAMAQMLPPGGSIYSPPPPAPPPPPRIEVPPIPKFDAPPSQPHLRSSGRNYRVRTCLDDGAASAGLTQAQRDAYARNCMTRD